MKTSLRGLRAARQLTADLLNSTTPHCVVCKAICGALAPPAAKEC